MRHFFKMGVIKPGELLSTFQKKQKNEFICVKLVITLIFCNEKVPFIVFLSKIHGDSRHTDISDDKVAEIINYHRIPVVMIYNMD